MELKDDLHKRWQRAQALRFLASKRKKRESQQLYAIAAKQEAALLREGYVPLSKAEREERKKEGFSTNTPGWFRKLTRELKCSACKSTKTVWWYRWRTPEEGEDRYVRLRVLGLARRQQMESVYLRIKDEGTVVLCRTCAQE